MIRTAAQDDIVRLVERFAAQGLPAIARRFAAAVLTAIETAIETPAAGLPHTALLGLHTRPVKGFTDVMVYYLASSDRSEIVRVLHTKRQIETV
jgi:plasmid stabilization system protein ParE